MWSKDLSVIGDLLVGLLAKAVYQRSPVRHHLKIPDFRFRDGQSRSPPGPDARGRSRRDRTPLRASRSARRPPFRAISPRSQVKPASVNPQILRKRPFYHGARTDGDDAWFDAPMSGGWGPNGFGWDKATFHLEICAYCADDGKFNLLGCIRFDYMSDKSNNKFKFFGGEPYGDGGIRQKVHKPTRMYNDAMKRWEKKHNEGHPFFE
jgi:hypothetical protein